MGLELTSDREEAIKELLILYSSAREVTELARETLDKAVALGACEEAARLHIRVEALLDDLEWKKKRFDELAGELGV